MPFVCIVINTTDTIAQANQKVTSHAATNQREGVVDARNYLEEILAHRPDAIVQVTTRDTDPAVATSGTGSKQVSYNVK